MDERGQLKVNEFFQVEGHTDVFALGDCTNADVSKTVIRVEQQVPVAVKNLSQKLRGQEKMTAYKPGVTEDNQSKYRSELLCFFILISHFQPWARHSTLE